MLRRLTTNVATEPEPLTEEGFPIYMLKTKAPNGSCIFLTDGRCSVYPARTHTCRIYPLTVGPGERDREIAGLQELCVYPRHCAGMTLKIATEIYFADCLLAKSDYFG